MDARSSARISRESSPDRAKMVTTTTTTVKRSTMQLQPKAKASATAVTRTVQIVYYLSRNGQLEHPHFMELQVHRQLRLRDFMERLTALRGKGMPALYSWSSKRSYKNGYVWNDLAENDVIFPSDGSDDYVLKGSELLGGCAGLIQEQNIPPTGRRQIAAQDHPKRSPLPSTTITPRLGQATNNNNYEYRHFEEEEEVDEEEAQEVVLEMEDEEKTSYSSSTTSRCSRGVSTDHELLPPLPNHTTNNIKKGNSSVTSSKRFEDGDPIEPGARGNSVLLQLISCGNMALTTRAKNTAPPTSSSSSNNNNVVVGVRKSSGCDGSNYYSDSLRKGVLYKAATAGDDNNNNNNNNINRKVVNGYNKAVEGVKKVEEAEISMIRYMSENPRFGNLQAEDKEYFSGSIVESMISEDRARDPPLGTLKRSNSYGELDRSSKAGLDEEAANEEDEDIKDRVASKGTKCIPRNICSLTSKPALRKQN